MSFILSDFGLAWLAYLIITISPGPANLAIIATSMEHGRKAGLSVAVGVLTGSVTWGILAAMGLSALLMTYGWLVNAVKITGGIYLLWLALRSLQSAIKPAELIVNKKMEMRPALHYFFRGLAIHLTNPKAIFGWVAIISVGTTSNPSSWTPFLVVLGCFLLGTTVFAGYAIVFSTTKATQTYLSFKKWIGFSTAAIFGFAGIKLLLSRN